ncbi:MAG TPA: hypothetical protein VFB60_11800 [Ktedonobacteraceae bacterium]|nr:hypothetical protein [Ktedonobacteraceae bacterium]
MSAIPEIGRLEQTIRELEAYEMPASPGQCQDAIQAVLALMALLQQALERNGQSRELGLTIPITVEMVALHYAIDQAKEARLQLAAFIPICQSSGHRALRRRKIAVYRLREFTKAATEAFARQVAAPQLRPRPDYLRLVESPLARKEPDNDE